MYRALLYKFVLALTIALLVFDSISVAFDGDETDHTGCPKGNVSIEVKWVKLKSISNITTDTFVQSILRILHF